jgi:hypothetical protein
MALKGSQKRKPAVIRRVSYTALIFAFHGVIQDFRRIHSIIPNDNFQYVREWTQPRRQSWGEDLFVTHSVISIITVYGSNRYPKYKVDMVIFFFAARTNNR